MFLSSETNSFSVSTDVPEHRQRQDKAVPIWNCHKFFHRHPRSSPRHNLSFSSFLPNDEEKEALRDARGKIFAYMVHKEADASDQVLVNLKTYFGIQSQCTPVVEQSNVVYLSIVDMHADSTEAMEAVASKLHREYGIGVRADHLIVVGDAKPYAQLQELKHSYGAELDWLLPFIGDWHLLLNYQSVLMKIYYEAGLKDLAEAAGYRGETLTSLPKCSNCTQPVTSVGSHVQAHVFVFPFTSNR